MADDVLRQTIDDDDRAARGTIALHERVSKPERRPVLKACRAIVDALGHDQKLLLFGNGGSAADAQHVAAELVGRFQRERAALAAIALTTDTSIVTAIGNDYAFEVVFSRGRSKRSDGKATSRSASAPADVRRTSYRAESGASRRLKAIALTGTRVRPRWAAAADIHINVCLDRRRACRKFIARCSMSSAILVEAVGLRLRRSRK